MDEALNPPLSAAMPELRSSVAEDIQFFALSWAAGLAFFLVYFS